MTTDIVVVALRALAFVAVVQSAGCAISCIYFSTYLKDDGHELRKLTASFSYLAIGLVAVQHLTEPARLTASFSGIWDASLQLILLQSDAGAARALRILGLAVIAASILRSERARRCLVPIGATVTLGSFLLMGHTADHSLRWLLAMLLIAHLVIAAFWFGAVTTFIVGASRIRHSTFAEMVVGFSRDAGWWVPVIGVAGLALAYVLLPELSSLANPYGRLLILKLAAFGVLMVLAAWNKFRLAPAMAAGDRSAAIGFRRIAIAEWALIASVLGATAVMTGLFGPDPGAH